MSENLTVIYEARTAADANELQQRLANAGLEAVVLNEIDQMETGTDAIGLPRPLGVAVLREHADAGRQIAEAFDEELFAKGEAQQAAAGETEATEPAEPEEGKEDALWPLCPECGARRVTTCPVCKTSGSHFPLADANASEASEPAELPTRMVICSTCDEPFMPQYLRHCEWCGHEFEDGVERSHEPVEEVLSGRAIAVILALVALLIAMLIYFAILL